MEYHPKRGDRGEKIAIDEPHQPTSMESWSDPTQHATTVPGHDQMPKDLHDVPFEKVKTPDTWRGVEGTGDFHEPPMKPVVGRKTSVGVIMVEPDKRVWVVHPTNQFGGYHATFPKGTVEHGLSMRENAIKETHEESGLVPHLHDHLGDFQRTTSVARYYVGSRRGGHPSDAGWESQAVSLVPMDRLHEVLTHPADQPIIDALRKKYRD